MTDQATENQQPTTPLGVSSSDGLGPRWWDCATHGRGRANAWGCPECVREMREEIKRLHGEAGVLRTWINAALVPLQAIANLDDFEDGGEGMNALIAAGRALVA